MTPARGFPFRYELLDGLRGLAALAVVASHLGIVDVGRQAVMVFFVISGYCIAAAAESCRRNGLAFRAFMARRLHRIYPPYFFAVVFYVLTRWLKIAMGGPNELHRPWTDWLQNLTMTQWLWLVVHPAAEASRNPKLVVAAFWSLNYEEQFYLVMALALLLAVRRGLPLAAVVIALVVPGLAWNFAWPGKWITGLFIEYWIDFAVGASLFYVLCLYPRPGARLAFAGAVVTLVLWSLLQILPWSPDTVLRQRAWFEFAVAGTFALLLLLLRPFSARISHLHLWKPIAALGTISYSLYLIHQFNLYLASAIVNRIVPWAWEPVRWSAMLTVQIAVAAVFWYLCERPFLNRSARRSAAVTNGRVTAGA